MNVFQVGDFTIKLVDNPADALSMQEKRKLLTESIPLVQKVFRNEIVSEAENTAHLFEVSTLIYVEDLSGTLIGFSSCIPVIVENHTIIHLKGCILHPAYQGRGLYNILTTTRILHEARHHDNKTLLIGTRTQNPRVFQNMSMRLGLYPQVHEKTPEDLRKIAEVYAAHIWEKREASQPQRGLALDENMVITRAYDYLSEKGDHGELCIYGKNIPWAVDERVNDFFRKNLHLSSGDAILLLGPFSFERTLDVLRQAIHKIDPLAFSLEEWFSRIKR